MFIIEQCCAVFQPSGHWTMRCWILPAIALFIFWSVLLCRMWPHAFSFLSSSLHWCVQSFCCGSPIIMDVTSPVSYVFHLGDKKCQTHFQTIDWHLTNGITVFSPKSKVPSPTPPKKNKTWLKHQHLHTRNLSNISEIPSYLKVKFLTLKENTILT